LIYFAAGAAVACRIGVEETDFRFDMKNTLGYIEIVINHRAPAMSTFRTKLSAEATYDPNHLLDCLISKLNLKNDAALARALEVAAPVISKIRHRRLPVGASMLIRMHEISEMSIAELRVLMGDRREKFRISAEQFKPKEVAQV
jgi:hypothetical protein